MRLNFSDEYDPQACLFMCFECLTHASRSGWKTQKMNVIQMLCSLIISLFLTSQHTVVRDCRIYSHAVGQCHCTKRPPSVSTLGFRVRCYTAPCHDYSQIRHLGHSLHTRIVSVLASQMYVEKTGF